MFPVWLSLDIINLYVKLLFNCDYKIFRIFKNLESVVFFVKKWLTEKETMQLLYLYFKLFFVCS